MEIHSGPSEKTIVLRDVDVNLLGGDTQPLTVYPEDTLTIGDDGRIEHTVARTGERVVILASHVRWYSVREREIVVKDEVKK